MEQRNGARGTWPIARRLRARLSYANVTATLALIVALGGGSFAVAALSGREKTVVKKIARKQANKRITKRGPGLSVKHAGSAGSANTAGFATRAGSADTANSAGSARPSGPASGDLTGSYPNPTIAPPEAFHEVGAPGEPAFQNSCQNLSGGAATAGFYIDREGVVHLKGRYTCPSNGTAFTLPPGYRTGTTQQFALASAGPGAVVAVNPSGTVGCGTTDCFLNGITFLPGT
jgi:hypothetical protein